MRRRVLAGVWTLAGGTNTASGRPVRFAQLSGVADSTRALGVIDRAVALLASSGS